MKQALLIFILLCSTWRLCAEDPASQWSSDLSAALIQAGKEERLVLVNFTGSDWCIWCHRIRDEILSKHHFLDYAKERFSLVVLDFPQKTPLSPEQQKLNADWAKKYNIESFPTILVLNPAGEELGRIPYIQGGPKTFVRELQRISKKNGLAALPK